MERIGIMKYEIIITDKFKKSFKKLDRQVQIIIKDWIEKNLVSTNNSRNKGKTLAGNLKGSWRYRIGYYRIIAEIQDDKLILVMVDVGHRSKIY